MIKPGTRIGMKEFLVRLWEIAFKIAIRQCLVWYLGGTLVG